MRLSHVTGDPHESRVTIRTERHRAPGEIIQHHLVCDPVTKRGVPSDLDLARLSAPNRVPSATDNTGTLPFLALDLLNERAFKDLVRRLSRHDAESISPGASSTSASTWMKTTRVGSAHLILTGTPCHPGARVSLTPFTQSSILSRDGYSRCLPTIKTLCYRFPSFTLTGWVGTLASRSKGEFRTHWRWLGGAQGFQTLTTGVVAKRARSDNWIIQ